MSKSLLNCVLETVPRMSRLIPSHASRYILWDVVADAAALNKAFCFSVNRKKSKNTAPWGGGGVPHCEKQPLVKVPLADPAGNKDGNMLLVTWSRLFQGLCWSARKNKTNKQKKLSWTLTRRRFAGRWDCGSGEPYGSSLRLWDHHRGRGRPEGQHREWSLIHFPGTLKYEPLQPYIP